MVMSPRVGDRCVGRIVLQVPGGELGGFTVAAVQDQLLHLVRPSGVRGSALFHAVIVARRRLGRIGQTTHSSTAPRG